jgi:peptidoglycan/LPS O-acetylase OafA/YrhL
MSTTIGSTLARHKGMGPGFDLMRLGLACAIFYGHAKWIAGSSAGPATLVNELVANGMDLDQARAAALDMSPLASIKRACHLALVPMFFALSGFLVSGSAERLRAVKPFLAFRILRIVPALSVEVVLSALVLGPLFTTLALTDYLTHPEFVRYFGNIAGIVHLSLPGVFAGNPATDNINVNLWTLPSEFYCYLIAALLIATGILFRPVVLLVAMSLVTAILLAASLLVDFGVTMGNIYGAPVVSYYFFVGCVFYQWRDRIPFRAVYFVLACVLACVSMAFPHGVFLAPAFLTYATVYVGCIGWPRLPLIHRGDYSYGIYLYGFPITQALVATVPALRGHENWLALAAGALTVAFAVASWHVVEKPMLRFKRHFGARVAPQTTDQRRPTTGQPAIAQAA